nr:hypothetical protein [Pseudomonas viridiflava]
MKVKHERHERFDAVWVTLERLRDDIRSLERSELERVSHLRGHQTVDDLEALQQSFVKLDHAVLDIEQTLASLGEATGEIGKL